MAAPPQQRTAQQQQNAPQQHPQQQQQGQEADPIVQFKELIPRLKASLENVMRISGKAFKENSQADNLGHISEENTERLDQHLEHFYSLCDQIEMNLKLALECAQQSMESSKYTPVPVNSPVCKQDTPASVPPTEHQPYHQYLATVQAQIACVKEIRDAFIECTKKIGERQRPLSLQQQQQPQQQQQQQQPPAQQQQAQQLQHQQPPPQQQAQQPAPQQQSMQQPQPQVNSSQQQQYMQYQS